ncbi:MAG: GDP-mannose 4,6-dehydratase [Bacteroidota bacterium]|nr:GDP-mannose 4,6-dehydratase [Bacteroidota bacterium]
MKTILITGVGGFAGSHLAGFLVQQHPELSLHGIVRDAEKIENIRPFVDHIQLHPCDIVDFQSVFRVMKEVKPDIIFHLAGQAFVPSSFERTAETFSINVIGAINIFEAVKACDIAPRILITTSGEIYGETEGLPLHTETTVPRPVNPYAASKTSIDYIAQTYRSYDGLDIVIVRPFNHTGPRQKPSFVCSSLAHQIAAITRQKREPVLHVGNIKARRDFTDVRDVVRGYWMASQTHDKDYFVFNICSGNVFSIEEIIHLFEEISGTKFSLDVEKKRLRGYDIQLLAGEAALLRKKTGWQPAIPFRQTLTDLLAYWMGKEE